MMHPLNEYISGRREKVPRKELERLISEHEWFTTARRVRAVLSGEKDDALTLPLMFRNTIAPQIARHKTFDSPGVPAKGGRETDVIDRFLEHGDHRIVPSDHVNDVDVDVDIDPRLVSEELAEIYRAQGMTEEADEIYRILNLRM